ncbi:MAG: ferric reductase-like transmembrane domain-containing protein [Candidatus Moraniibacteriota bacterium]
MKIVLGWAFWWHDWASTFLAKHLFGVKRCILIVAHLSLFGFFFPEMRKDFGELAGNLLIVILFLSPISKILRMRLLLQAMSLRRELGITMAYLATVHGVGFLLDPEWFALFIAPYWRDDFLAIDPAYLFGMGAYVLTLPLLLTSNSLAQRFLGSKWKLLHRLVYALFVLAIFHRFLVRGGADIGEVFQVTFLLASYALAKILAWKNFLPTLQKSIDWVALQYKEYTIARKEAAPPVV